MPPPHPKKRKIFICKSYIIVKSSLAPNGSTEEKLKSLEKSPNTAKNNNIISVAVSEDRWKCKWKYDKSTLILDFNKVKT